VAEHSRFAIRLRDTHALDLGAVRGRITVKSPVIGTIKQMRMFCV
jgi:hypothetical protein